VQIRWRSAIFERWVVGYEVKSNAGMDVVVVAEVDSKGGGVLEETAHGDGDNGGERGKSAPNLCRDFGFDEGFVVVIGLVSNTRENANFALQLFVCRLGKN